MASRTGSRFGRRIVLLAVAVVLFCAAYTAGWYYFARGLETRAAATLASLNGGGVRAFCEEPEARGFPFRIGLYCKGVFYENVSDGVSIRAGRMQSAANVYQPYRVLGQLDGPAKIILPFTIPLEARWESLLASTRLSRPLPETLSVEGKKVEISAEEGDPAPLLTVDDVQFHARQREADLEIAVSFRDLVAGAEIAPGLPPIEGRVLGLVQDGVSLLKEKVHDLRGRSATIEEMVVGVTGERAGFSLSGPISVSDDGRIDADLSITINDPRAVAEVMAQIFPDEGDQIRAATGMLASLENQPLPVRITRGKVFLGFIPLGEIPAIE